MLQAVRAPWPSSAVLICLDYLQDTFSSFGVCEAGFEHTRETLGRGVPLIGLLEGAACLPLLPIVEPADLAAASAAASAASQALAASAVTAICTQCKHA